MPTIRKPYTHLRCATPVLGESLTKQSFKNESNINLIMKKYKKTGFLDPSLIKDADYMDSPDIDFQTAMNIVIQAQSDFDALPADLRKRFANDPATFLDFVGNEANIPEMQDLGLMPKELPVAPESAPATEGGSVAPSEA